MILYHGTSECAIGSILRDGIRPRSRRRGNWTNYPSRADMVYATRAYAAYFAVSAAANRRRACRAAVIEIEVDEARLYPDEDFIAQNLARQLGKQIKDVHQRVVQELLEYRHHATDSLEGLGNCAHRGVVPADQIRRVALFCGESSLGQFCDPTISMINYRLCGERYRSSLEWLFGDREDYVIADGIPNQQYIEMVSLSTGSDYSETASRLFRDRSGIEVFSRDAAAELAKN